VNIYHKSCHEETKLNNEGKKGKTTFKQ